MQGKEELMRKIKKQYQLKTANNLWKTHPPELNSEKRRKQLNIRHITHLQKNRITDQEYLITKMKVLEARKVQLQERKLTGQHSPKLSHKVR